MKGRGIARLPIVAAAALGAGLLWMAPARAGLGHQLIRGITYSMTPNLGTVQNGPNLNQNVFSQRFSQNPITGGGSYEETRYFGSDTYGNTDTLNLGILDVQLGSPAGTALQGSGVYNQIGYTTLLMPSINWTSRSTGRNQTLLGATAAQAAPIHYNIKANNGIENYTAVGDLTYNSTGSVNALGFYNIQLAANNTGTLTSSGVADNRTQDTSFDLGPVNLSGNIFLDAALAAIKGVAGQLGLPTNLLPQGPTAKDRTPDEISAAITAGQSITAPELQSLITAHINDPDGVPLPADTGSTPAASSGAGSALPVPEPGTIGLLIIGALGLLARPMRWGRR